MKRNNRLGRHKWHLYKTVNYYDGENLSYTKSWKDRKLERAHFGITTLSYRTVKRMKIVYNYYRKHNGQWRITFNTSERSRVKKFYGFLTSLKETYSASSIVVHYMSELKEQERLKLFTSLGD